MRPPPSGTVHLAPLGGLGEVGMNCMALSQGNDTILIDCGVTFPNSDNGVDVIHPRFDAVMDVRDRLRGLVITHGHEDHIGAVPYLLDALRVPIWAPPHAMRLIRRRLEEHRFDIDDLELTEIGTRQPFSVGSFHIEPVRVTHSIADATALSIETIAGRIVHTGDFKLDEHPSDNEHTDRERLAAWAEAGVRLMLSDSTNIFSPGRSTSETAVGSALEEVVRESSGLCLVGLFSSNIQRLLSLGRVAQRTGRRIALLGRSMHNHVETARALGMLDWPDDMLVDIEMVRDLDRAEVLVLATGTQGEPRAALRRLSEGTHRAFRLVPNDTVIFSSRVIPGNDRPVFDMIDNLLRRGARVVTRATHPRIHASGHAHRDEQAAMIDLIRPASFMPVHGTLHHLTHHADLARTAGVKDVLVSENGDIVELSADAPLKRVDRFDAGRVHVFDGEPVPSAVLRQRGQLGREGVLAVSILLDGRGRLRGQPQIRGRGVYGELDRDVPYELEKAVKEAVRELRNREVRRDGAVVDAVRVACRRVTESLLGARMAVEVFIHRIGDNDWE